MLKKMFFAVFIVFIVFISPFLHAKVNRVSFDQLVGVSDLILYGEAFSVSYNEDYSGEAKLKVISVLKGKYANEYITYKWDSAPHSRDLDRAAQRYIIYVKNDNGSYFSAVHGAGVWNVYLDMDAHGKSVVANDFILQLPESIFKCVRFCNDKRKEMKITLDALFLFFDNISNQ
jgi:hypothetical protein